MEEKEIGVSEMKKTRRVFAIDLKGFDLSKFEKNPIILMDNRVEMPPVGVAQYINEDTVAIEFFKPLSNFIDHIEITPSYITDHEDGEKILINLSASIKGFTK